MNLLINYELTLLPTQLGQPNSLTKADLLFNSYEDMYNKLSTRPICDQTSPGNVPVYAFNAYPICHQVIPYPICDQCSPTIKRQMIGDYNHGHSDPTVTQSRCHYYPAATGTAGTAGSGTESIVRRSAA